MADKKYLGFLALLIIPIYFGYDYLKKKDMKMKLNRHLLMSKISVSKNKKQMGGSSKTKKMKTKKHRKH